jgi:hypothetical protein
MKQAWMVLAGAAILFAWALARSARRPKDAPLPMLAESPESDHVSLNVLTKPTPVASIDLQEAAALCTAISRLQSEADLQPLLARTSSLLKASGVVVWMAAGEEMFPVAWHGYDSKQLSQLGPIGHSSLNAAADAWRTGTLQSVAGGPGGSRSALVAPLLGIERCLGVLALEVAPGCEADAATQAVASLVAAQLSTVLGGWPAGSSLPPAEVVAFERAASS